MIVFIKNRNNRDNALQPKN